ncbi:GNAT family N-acetyltransferase [Sporosarcina koreensis]|uniref:GNAT family N-acetyltransferase n=1 Tax=Sporosarcina koreensis TaxID=334735 RepID=A0ABW0TVW7_9BACL
MKGVAVIIKEVRSETIHPLLKNLLSYVTSEKRIADEYSKYIQLPNRKLYVAERNGIIVGCIGVEIIEYTAYEIKHIAVFPSERGSGMGSEMIDFVCDRHSLHRIIAETDLDAVEFYRNYGFKVSSLGEKYPGVERFLCEYIMKTNNDI